MFRSTPRAFAALVEKIRFLWDGIRALRVEEHQQHVLDLCGISSQYVLLSTKHIDCDSILVYASTSKYILYTLSIPASCIAIAKYDEYISSYIYARVAKAQACKYVHTSVLGL